MKPVRIIFTGVICGLVSTVHADIASVQYVQSVIQDVDPTVTGADVALTGYAKAQTASAVAATDTVNQAIGKIEKALDGTVSANADITASGSTNKIVQYDAKGLVVAGTTAGALATLDAVGSSEITDGSIVDADISSSAAIATSKISGLDTALSGKVPTTTTVNSKALSTNITLDGSDVALTGYAKAQTASAVAATDTVNEAIGKIEKALDGKQASGDYVPTTTTVNSKALSTNITLDGSDVALTGYAKAQTASAVAATDTVNQAIGKIEKALDGTVSANADITASGSTNKIVQYDAKGLVVAGTTAGALATLDAVGSSEITDGSIVDADISSSAAIATSKISGLDTALSGKVPTTTTVNSKALSTNITLDGSDVALTGYAKAQTASAVAATDTVNEAIGKIEKALDGKQASGDYVPTSTTVNGHALTSNVTVSKSDVGLGNVANVDTTNAANISSGTMDVARLPVGTTSTTVAAGDDARFNTVSTTQPSGTPPTGTVYIWFN